MNALRTDDLMARARATLSSTFGYSSFRPLQEEVVRTILSGNDVFVLMPTGGGKSLCYQLPALLLDGVTVVVSPLIALMKDQVDALTALGVAATYINSSLTPGEIRSRTAAMRKGAVKLVYVAPERLVSPDFLEALGGTQISFIAVDEAHCISEWGHDFRPEYRRLAELRARFPHVPMGAFTATATRRVQADIRAQLGVEGAASFQGRFNRRNLLYEVRPKRGAYDAILRYLRSHPTASGIIYCLSRVSTEELAERLRGDGVGAEAYHAGLESEERQRRQDAFTRDNVRVMTATIAFGMGIDKPDVRFVMHYDLPKTLENYYQESGRAGRDGERSDCILFYTPGDAVKQHHFIAEKPPAERNVAIWQLNQMVSWAESVTCRRRALLAYFDEDLAEEQDPCCDACTSPATLEDATVPAQKFLSCVKRTGERFGMGYVIDVLRGKEDARITRHRHHTLTTFGIGRDHPATYWQELARELIRGGYLNQNPEKYNSVSVTERGEDVLFRGAPVSVPVREKARATSGAGESVAFPDLFERLRAVRKRLADERRVPPYVVCGDVSLRDMVNRLPGDAAALRAVSGIGSHRADEFGGAFLEEIAAYRRETGATPVPVPTALNPPHPSGPGLSVRKTVDLFRAGLDLPTIARSRELALGTVEGHLAEALEAGEDLEIDRLVAAEKRARIESTFAAVGDATLSPAMERLGSGYTYAELRFTRSYGRGARSHR